MVNESDGSKGGEWLQGMAVQSENIAFGAEELIACVKCGKPNPPNRASCLYCATPIELPEERKFQVRINLRPLENWEKGYNLVLVRTTTDPADMAAAARYLSVGPEILSAITAAAHPLPIVRLESETDAKIAVEQLEKFGLEVLIVSDEILNADRPPVRLRAIEFHDGSIVVTAFNSGDKIEIGPHALRLIVAGAIIESKTESVEKRKKKERKLIQETETATDEKLIDIYSAADATGFRIQTSGFDFSCLGSEKGLLASQNIDRLLERLQEFSARAKLIGEYRVSVSSLNTVWEMDRQKDFQGLTRTGFGRSGFAKVDRKSNLMQFTKYSRLQCHLL